MQDAQSEIEFLKGVIVTMKRTIDLLQNPPIYIKGE
jgi:hypothetical protein